MGKSEIRTVGKVSFDKPASEQDVLHVRSPLMYISKEYSPLTILVEPVAPR